MAEPLIVRFASLAHQILEDVEAIRSTFFSLACVTQHGFADNRRHLCSTEPSGAVTTHRRESWLLFLIKQLPLFFLNHFDSVLLILLAFFHTYKKERWRHCHSFSATSFCAKFSSPPAIAARALRFSSMDKKPNTRQLEKAWRWALFSSVFFLFVMNWKIQLFPFPANLKSKKKSSLLFYCH